MMRFCDRAKYAKLVADVRDGKRGHDGDGGADRTLSMFNCRRRWMCTKFEKCRAQASVTSRLELVTYITFGVGVLYGSLSLCG
jgi:hypothetical protein